MRPGEIFGLTWGRINATYTEIQQRVYRGLVDTPKTKQSMYPLLEKVGCRQRAGIGKLSDGKASFHSPSTTLLFQQLG